MALPRITLIEMAEAVGDMARLYRSHVERWDRDHPGTPLPDHDSWVRQARIFETTHLTLSLMALDEDASRKFVGSLMATAEGKQLMAMLMPAKPKAEKPSEVAAA